MDITRADFLKKFIRAVLATLLVAITLLLSWRTVVGNECNGCQWKGICRGESNCSKFLTDKR
ncbi:MAG TPA: hypothetical protein DFI01_01040 [Bacteroidales bacterium]|nr:hypothetical protein [Bacteroidales bacterium]